MSADDAKDIAAWSSVIDLPESDITSRMALTNLIAFALKKTLEVEALKAAMDGRPNCPVLKLVRGGQ